MPCDDGPYVWDKSEHREGNLEGIGSTFQFRKSSLIASHILKAKWIGKLINSHEKEEGDQSRYFGLSYPSCDRNSLVVHQKQTPLRFVYVTEGNTSTVSRTVRNLQLSNTTVVVFDWEKMDEAHNFVVFDETFRKRFHQQRLSRQTTKRKLGEFWVSIHFRWGDVKTKDPNKPDQRTGMGFTEYCLCIRYILHNNPGIKIFLFAENFTSTNMCEALKSKNVHLFNESHSWKRDIDIMSQSQLLIGGESSFFILGAHLCEACTVIHNSDFKFAESKYEKRLPKHLKAIYCPTQISCYLEFIRQNIKPSINNTSESNDLDDIV